MVSKKKADSARKQHDTPLFLAIVGVLAVPLVYVLQANGAIDISVAWSAIIYAAIVVVFIWAFLRWEIPSCWHPVARFALLLILSVGLVILSSVGVMKDYKRTQISESEMTTSRIEVYFGEAAASRGEVVAFKNDHEKAALLSRGTGGGHATLRLIPYFRNQIVERVPIYVRNTSKNPIGGLRIKVSSNRIMNAVSPNARLIGDKEEEFDFGELRSYQESGNELVFVVEISTTDSPVTNPASLLVTIDGEGMQAAHSEMIQYAFIPIG